MSQTQVVPAGLLAGTVHKKVATPAIKLVGAAMVVANVALVDVASADVGVTSNQVEPLYSPMTKEVGVVVASRSPATKLKVGL